MENHTITVGRPRNGSSTQEFLRKKLLQDKAAREKRKQQSSFSVKKRSTSPRRRTKPVNGTGAFTQPTRTKRKSSSEEKSPRKKRKIISPLPPKEALKPTASKPTLPKPLVEVDRKNGGGMEAAPRVDSRPHLEAAPLPKREDAAEPGEEPMVDEEDKPVKPATQKVKPIVRPIVKPKSFEEWDTKADGCRYLEDAYEFLNDIDEGTYGMVSRCRCKFTKRTVALKKVKLERNTTSDGFFPKSSLREISLLLQLRHPNIVYVREVVVSKRRNKKKRNDVYMAMEFCEHDLRALMYTREFPWSKSEIKCLMMQLLEGIDFMHSHWIIHRDLKTANLLLNDENYLKICDFGMARKFGSPLQRYTALVVTLWYRAPEILLQDKPMYTTAVDMWSVGCIFAEFFLNKPLFNAKQESEQIEQILELLGTPKKKEWPEFFEYTKNTKLKKNYKPQYHHRLPVSGSALGRSNKLVLDDQATDLLLRLLAWNPEQRLTAKEAMKHQWFQESPRPVDRELLPTFPSLNKEQRNRALARVKRENRERKLDLEEYGGFHFG